eukprot:g11373.t1
MADRSRSRKRERDRKRSRSRQRDRDRKDAAGEKKERDRERDRDRKEHRDRKERDRERQKDAGGAVDQQAAEKDASAAEDQHVAAAQQGAAGAPGGAPATAAGVVPQTAAAGGAAGVAGVVATKDSGTAGGNKSLAAGEMSKDHRDRRRSRDRERDRERKKDRERKSDRDRDRRDTKRRRTDDPEGDSSVPAPITADAGGAPKRGPTKADELVAKLKEKKKEAQEKKRQAALLGQTPMSSPGTPGDFYDVVGGGVERDAVTALVNEMLAKEKQKKVEVVEVKTNETGKSITFEDIMGGKFVGFEQLYGNKYEKEEKKERRLLIGGEVKVEKVDGAESGGEKPAGKAEAGAGAEAEADGKNEGETSAATPAAGAAAATAASGDTTAAEKANANGEAAKKADTSSAEADGKLLVPEPPSAAAGEAAAAPTASKAAAESPRAAQAPRLGGHQLSAAAKVFEKVAAAQRPVDTTANQTSTAAPALDLGIKIVVAKTRDEDKQEEREKSDFMKQMQRFLQQKNIALNPNLHGLQTGARGDYLDQDAELREDEDEVAAQIREIEEREKQEAEEKTKQIEAMTRMPKAYQDAAIVGPIKIAPEDVEKKEKPKLQTLLQKRSVPNKMSAGGESSAGPKISAEALKGKTYAELQQIFTARKELPRVDHNKIEYVKLEKDLYHPVKEIQAMKPHEVDNLRKVHNDIKLNGKEPHPKPVKTFYQCGFSQELLTQLEKREIELPFPIQMQAIPCLLSGRDVIALAPTGSGKTLAYMLPMMKHIQAQEPVKYGVEGPIGLVLAPTRELATQIFSEAKKVGAPIGVSVCAAIGGQPVGQQLGPIRRGCDVIVGTPGRMVDIFSLSNGNISNLKRVSYVVVDEADRMLDQGFGPQISDFLNKTQPKKQLAMFSATFPDQVRQIAKKYLKKPLQIKIGTEGTAALRIKQTVEIMVASKKVHGLLRLLGQWAPHASIIVFVRERGDAEALFKKLAEFHYPSLLLHGGVNQDDRAGVIKDFRLGEKDLDAKANILIATGVAARGLDTQTKCVINFSVPNTKEDYVQQIGRTGRAGARGCAYTFITPTEADKAQMLIDVMRSSSQTIDPRLQELANTYQLQVNSGQVEQKKQYSGYGGRGFTFDKSEVGAEAERRKQYKTQEGIMDDNLRRKKDFLEGFNKGNEDDEEEIAIPDAKIPTAVAGSGEAAAGGAAAPTAGGAGATPGTTPAPGSAASPDADGQPGGAARDSTAGGKKAPANMLPSPVTGAAESLGPMALALKRQKVQKEEQENKIKMEKARLAAQRAQEALDRMLQNKEKEVAAAKTSGEYYKNAPPAAPSAAAPLSKASPTPPPALLAAGATSGSFSNDAEAKAATPAADAKAAGAAPPADQQANVEQNGAAGVLSKAKAPPPAKGPELTEEEQKQCEEEATKKATAIVTALKITDPSKKEETFKQKYEHALRIATERKLKTKKSSVVSAPSMPKPKGVSGPPRNNQTANESNAFHVPNGAVELTSAISSKAGTLPPLPQGWHMIGPMPVPGTTRMIETLKDGTKIHYDAFEINEYPEQARREMSRRELKESIEELSGCRLQVKGRYIPKEEPNPGNERKLYVEIQGPTLSAVASGKKTLNLGSHAQMLGGIGRRYDPRTGTMTG